MNSISAEEPLKISIQEYLKKEKIQPIYKMKIHPQFSPFDINLQFVIEEGWSIADRLRFHFETGIDVEQDHPLKNVFDHLKPHITIRRFDREEDSFITIFIQLDGGLDILSNDKEFAKIYLHGLFLNCPPSYHSIEELDIIEEGWVVDERIHAMFMGLLEGAIGWDIPYQIPPSIRQSLEEANKALIIANYRSCVVMCRRTIEALLKFAFRRLLKSEPDNKRGRALTLYAMIERFKKEKPAPIPAHLLQILDSIRLIGNVPGAHAEEIKDYRFSKADAEFALSSVSYFLEQYFTKIDSEVTEYYTLTIELNDLE